METATIIINAIVALVTGSVGYFFGHKKTMKEADSVGIANVEKALDIYKQMLDDMKLRYDAEIENLKSKLAKYENHIATLEGKIKELKSQK
jgi:CII-binding regulator of phage lambda lysogenization HflD